MFAEKSSFCAFFGKLFGAFFSKYFLTYFAYFLIYYETLHHSSASEAACRLIVISGEGLQDFRKSVLTYAKPKWM